MGDSGGGRGDHQSGGEKGGGKEDRDEGEGQGDEGRGGKKMGGEGRRREQRWGVDPFLQRSVHVFPEQQIVTTYLFSRPLSSHLGCGSVEPEHRAVLQLTWCPVRCIETSVLHTSRYTSLHTYSRRAALPSVHQSPSVPRG